MEQDLLYVVRAIGFDRANIELADSRVRETQFLWPCHAGSHSSSL